MQLHGGAFVDSQGIAGLIGAPQIQRLAGSLSLDRNKDVVRRHFELISEGDAKGAAALFAPKPRNHGREVSREDLLRVLESLAGLREQFAIQEIFAEGDGCMQGHRHREA